MATKVKTPKFYNRIIWIVQEGLQGGYMPNSLSFFATKSDATRYMLDRKHSAIDDGYKVYGSARDGYYSLESPDASDYNMGEKISLDSERASFYERECNLKSFDTFDDLIQYLND